MFRQLHSFYTKLVDKPSINFVMNLWSFVNLRYFKFKYSRNIFIFISNLDFLKIKYISILYRDWIYENIFFKNLNYLIILSLIFFLI